MSSTDFEKIDRRQFTKLALAMGASAAFGDLFGLSSSIAWRERRELFPEGVASGDPNSNSVLLWTRYPQDNKISTAELHLEISEDQAFRRVIATASAPVSAASDWTCRVLVGGLKPAHVYW